jgi:hypothetical protein
MLHSLGHGELRGANCSDPATAATSPKPSFTVEHLLASRFPTQLTAAPASELTWTSDAETFTGDEPRRLGEGHSPAASLTGDNIAFCLQKPSVAYRTRRKREA